MVDTTERDDAGEITESGDLGVFRLNVGDCINDPSLLSIYDEDQDEYSEFAQFDAVPCTQPHTGEVILVDDEFFADEADLPSEEVLGERSYEACVTAIEQYTGQPFADSPYETVPLFPTTRSWNQLDDRGIVCIGIELSEQTWEPIESTGSMRAAG